MIPSVFNPRGHILNVLWHYLLQTLEFFLLRSHILCVFYKIQDHAYYTSTEQGTTLSKDPQHKCADYFHYTWKCLYLFGIPSMQCLCYCFVVACYFFLALNNFMGVALSFGSTLLCFAFVMGCGWGASTLLGLVFHWHFKNTAMFKVMIVGDFVSFLCTI